MSEIKVCSKCGRILPIDRFRTVRPREYKSYLLGVCKDCEYKQSRKYIENKKKIKLNDDTEILIKREYKEIEPEKILDISKIENIIPCGTDEIFVKVMDCKNTWISNYGRVISYNLGKYNLKKGNYDNYGALRYSVTKDVYINEKCISKRTHIYASQTVVQEFIVNPDCEKNVFVWHSGNNKEDCYYRNLYPLNKEQYYAVRYNYNTTGDDSEEFILKVMNDIKYKPDDWSRKCLEPTVCGVGYCGSENVDYKSRSYLRWHDMMNRCYNDKFHERQSQYKKCTVCKEWHNYINFKKWYDSHYYIVENEKMDLDKDILIKGNKVYSPSTCCIAPHSINTLFLTGKKNRGDLPLGIWYDDKDERKYRASMNYCGHQIKLGTFDSAEEAFARYKEYKEDFIKDIAEQYKRKIPNKLYEVMINWTIESED